MLLQELTLPTLFGLATATFLIWYITTSLLAWYPLRHIPGPPLASFSYLWEAFTILGDQTFNKYRDLRSYGPLVRTAPGYIVTDDPEVLRTTMALRGKYTRDSWYRAVRFAPHLENMGSQMDTAAHDRLKTATTSGYSGREAGKGLEGAVDSQIVKLVDLIRRKYVSRGGENIAVDLSRLSRFFTMDVISLLLYSESWGHLDEGEDVLGWIGAMDTAVPLMTVAMEIPLLRTMLLHKWGLLGWFGPKETDKTGLGNVMRHVNEIIRRRFSGEEKPKKDMMGGFIRSGMTQTECEGESMLAVQAGNDTSAATLRATLLHLMLTPHAYGKFKAEIKHAVEQGKVSSPITNEEALKLPYTQAVVWEGFRVGNPVSFGHYKVVPEGGETFHGKYLPAGTRIGHNSIAMTHSKRIFGEDADIFRPERFLECDTERRNEMMHTLDMVFGGGRWMCSGKAIAVLELNKVFFELLRAFDFQPINPWRPAKESVYVARLHEDMWVRITEADWEQH